jgi:Protein of unknown function (DUF3088)
VAFLSTFIATRKNPGERFSCPDSNQVEGVLASFPELARKMPFEKPRRRVIELVGEQNQSPPVLILGILE